MKIAIVSFGLLFSFSTFAQTSPALVPGIFQQNIDHFGDLSGEKFKQRYWVDSEFSSPASHTVDDAPVLFHICGEGDASEGYFLNDNALSWAKELGAHIVYLEHRYYGQSLPFSDLSTDHLQYLTLGNVLEDLATFQKWITTNQGWKGKWISIGGSYSGTLSALYRQKHPELVVGALASSAPMISGQGEATGTQEDVDGLSSIDPSSDTGERSWVYQSCTTFGFWMADGPDLHATLETPSPWLCQQLFGNVGLVNSSNYNINFDAPFISSSAQAPSNILFTYGSDDVWTTIGLSEQTNANTAIVIQMINGAGHHFDLNLPTDSDSSDVLNARAEFVSLAKKWLFSVE